jgi:hypothetical protein
MSDEQRELLRQRQLDYVANDPRWAAHRAKLAEAPRRPETREKLAAAMLNYMANDPRWPEHRERMLQAGFTTNRFTLAAEEVSQVVKLRAKGRNFEYIAEELCVSDKVIRREMRALGIDTRSARPAKRVKPGKGHWRSFDPVELARPEI